MSGPNHSRIARAVARRSGHLAFAPSVVGNGNLRRCRRKFFRGITDVDCSDEDRGRNFALDLDLPAESLHLRLPGWYRSAPANHHQCAFCRRWIERAITHWFCAGRVDLLSIDRINCVHQRVAHRSVGDRNDFWLAVDWENGPVAQRFAAGSYQTMGICFRRGLFADDDGVASDRWNLGAFPSDGKEVFPDPLV